MQILRMSAQLLLSNNASDMKSDHLFFDYDEIYVSHDRIPEKKVIKIQESTIVKLIICNSLSYKRTDKYRKKLFPI